MILSGCSTTFTPVKNESLETIREVIRYAEHDYPSLYMQRCSDLMLLDDDKIETLINVLRENAQRYKLCALMHNELITLIKSNRDNP